MDIAEILVELRAERARFDKAIKALEVLETPRRHSRKSGTTEAESGLTRPIRLKKRRKSVQTLAPVIPIRSFGS